MSRTTWLCLFAAAALVTTACDKVALLAPTQSTITLSINSTTVAANQTAEVIATVVEQAGTAVHNGTVVTFASSVGTVEPREARTEGGVARATFRAGTQSGTATITATSGSAVGRLENVLVGGAAASTVTVRTDPSSVPQTGGVVQVLAVVRDASGNAVPGASVVFTADNGSLGSNSVIADQNGEARTTLNTNRQTVVRASVAGREGQATVAIVNRPTVGLTVSSATPAVGVPVSFTITPGTVTNGNPVQSMTFDPGDGSGVRNLGTGTTTVSHTYSSAGSYTATVTIVDTSGLRDQNSIVVTAQRSTPSVSITPSPTTATTNSPITFSITSTAGTGGPPIQSVLVTFPDGISRTIGPGSQTLSRSFAAPGTYVVTARAIDQAGTPTEATTSVIITARPAIEVTLDADPGDNNLLTCNPPRNSTVYPKTCTTTLPIPSLFQPLAQVRVVFTAGFSGQAPTNVTSYQWNFGDGSAGETTSNRNTDHVYTARGTYPVTVTVTTADGATGSQRLTLVIQ